MLIWWLFGNNLTDLAGYFHFFNVRKTPDVIIFIIFPVLAVDPTTIIIANFIRLLFHVPQSIHNIFFRIVKRNNNGHQFALGMFLDHNFSNSPATTNASLQHYLLSLLHLPTAHSTSYKFYRMTHPYRIPKALVQAKKLIQRAVCVATRRELT